MMVALVLLALFISYHAYLWLTLKPLPRILPTTWQPSVMTPKVSFVVPVWNDAHHLAAFVHSFQALSYPSKELILCAGGDDDSRVTAEQFASERIRVIAQLAGEGKQQSLAKSLPLVSGDIVYLTDIDCRPTDDVVHTLLEPLLSHKAEVVTGASRPCLEQHRSSLVKTHWAIEQVGQPTELSKTRGILGRNAALWTSILRETDALTVPASTGTDYTLAKVLTQAGYDIYFVPGAMMMTEYPHNVLSYSRKQARWIRNVIIIGWRYGAYREVKANLITVAIPFMLAIPLLLGLYHWMGLIVFSMLLTQLLLNRLRYQYQIWTKVDVYGVVISVSADLLASLRVCWQLLLRRHTW